jgi:hypothetical protein
MYNTPRCLFLAAAVSSLVWKGILQRDGWLEVMKLNLKLSPSNTFQYLAIAKGEQNENL